MKADEPGTPHCAPTPTQPTTSAPVAEQSGQAVVKAETTSPARPIRPPAPTQQQNINCARSMPAPAQTKSPVSATLPPAQLRKGPPCQTPQVAPPAPAQQTTPVIAQPSPITHNASTRPVKAESVEPTTLSVSTANQQAAQVQPTTSSTRSIPDSVPIHKSIPAAGSNQPTINHVRPVKTEPVEPTGQAQPSRPICSFSRVPQAQVPVARIATAQPPAKIQSVQNGVPRVSAQVSSKPIQPTMTRQPTNLPVVKQTAQPMTAKTTEVKQEPIDPITAPAQPTMPVPKAQKTAQTTLPAVATPSTPAQMPVAQDKKTIQHPVAVSGLLLRF